MTQPLPSATVAGIDVSRGKITVCLLSELPKDLKKFQRGYKALEFKSDREGVENLLALDFGTAILEPTGGHYSKLWATQLKNAGKIVKWVDHQSIANYRKGWGQSNKSDKSDAIALAMYGLERSRYIEPKNAELKDLCHQLRHYDRLANATINRLRQQLAWECPELSERKAARDWGKNPLGIWKAIAGIEVSTKWQKEFDRSIGTGISEFSAGQARILVDIQERQLAVELQAQEIMERPEYQPYMKVLENYGMGWGLTLPLLAAVYPITQFLEPDGSESKSHVETKTNKRARRNHSLSRFKLSCGLGMSSYQSGDTERWKAGGPQYVRNALWNWVRICVVMNVREVTPQIEILQTYYKHGSNTVIGGELKHFDPGVRNQKIMRVARRGLEMIYRDLIKIAQVQ